MRIAVRHLLLMSYTFLAVGCSSGQQQPESSLMLSYTIPAGWKIHEPSTPGVRVTYPLRHGPVRPNIADTIDAYDGTFDDLVNHEAAMIKSYMPKLDGFLMGKFVTVSQIEGTKVSYKCHLEGQDLFQAHYTFDLGGKAQVFSCTAPADRSAEYDTLFDRVMKTLCPRKDLQQADGEVTSKAAPSVTPP